MAMTDTSPPAAPAGTAPPPPRLPDAAAFRTGQGEDDRLIGQLAFARAVERGEAAAPAAETVEALRAQALADLSEFAFRYLHNRVEEVRREAVAAELARFGQPPSFLRLVAANLIALALGGALAAWLISQPEALAPLLGGG